MPNLEEFRNKIDAVDDKILDLLNERMTYVKSIGELKQSSGGSIYRPERERAIINRLKKCKFRTFRSKCHRGNLSRNFCSFKKFRNASNYSLFRA